MQNLIFKRFRLCVFEHCVRLFNLKLNRPKFFLKVFFFCASSVVYYFCMFRELIGFVCNKNKSLFYNVFLSPSSQIVLCNIFALSPRTWSRFTECLLWRYAVYTHMCSRRQRHGTAYDLFEDLNNPFSFLLTRFDLSRPYIHISLPIHVNMHIIHT